MTAPSSTAPTVSKQTCWLPEMYRYDYVKKYGNVSSSFLSLDATGKWMGIPEILLLSCLSALAGLILFTFIRKRFWDYGRIACRLFTPGDSSTEQNYDVFAHVYLGLSSVSGSVPSPVSDMTNIEEEDTGLCTYLHLWAELTDEEILLKCGPSALQYLQVQNIIILTLSVVTQMCLIFLLPFNMSGQLYAEDGYNFAMTTIANLQPTDIKLFVHCVIAAGFFAYGTYTLRFYARSIHVPAHWRRHRHGLPRNPAKATIMITRITRTLAGNENEIRKYFSEAYPNGVVLKIEFAYDIHELGNLTLKLKEAEIALRACESSNELMTVHHCRLLNLFRCRCVTKVRAKDFYEAEVARLKKEMDNAISKAKRRPLPICFVTFEKSDDADKVVTDFHRLFRPLPSGNKRPKTKLDSVLRTCDWKIIMAPKATDIRWENLNVDYKMWIKIALNVGALVLLVCFSTPSVIISLYTDHLEKKGIGLDETAGPPGVSALEVKILRQMVPTTLHLALTALLPYVIEGCEEYSRHDTHSAKQMHLMIKTFLYLLFMILILPSLGLTSGVIMFKDILFGPEAKHRWECFFIPDNPAFYINFVLTSSIFGAAIDLIRPGHIVYYLWHIITSRSRFELEYAKTMSVFRFPYGTKYAYMGAMFATTMAYCVVCPLIAPCSFVYFCLKSQVDRYNIYFAFDAHYVPQQMHLHAANILVGSCIFSQGALIAFTVVRKGGSLLSPDDVAAMCQTVLMLLTFAVSLALFFCQLVSGWFFQSSQISPFQYSVGESESAEVSSGDIAGDIGIHSTTDPGESAAEQARLMSLIEQGASHYGT